MIDGLLIYTGPTTKRADLIRLLTDLKFTEVILTHHHEDHTGLAHWIQQHKKTPIYIHEYGVGDCEKNGKIPLYRRAFWGSRKAFQPQTLPHLFKTKQYTWDIIHTPGHAHDHVALYNREKRWMFGGDLYVQGTPKSMFRSEEHTSELQSRGHLVCRLLLEKKKTKEQPGQNQSAQQRWGGDAHPGKSQQPAHTHSHQPRRRSLTPPHQQQGQPQHTTRHHHE